MDKPAEAALKRAIGMLEAILKRQITLHREMLVVADNKRDSIIKGDVSLLEKSVAEEKRLIGEIESEENRRQAVMPLVKNGLEVDASVEKLPDVIAKMPEPERGRMTEVRNELRALLDECSLKNRHNAELLKTSLEHVEAFLRTLSEAARQDAIYGKDGKRSGGGPSIIDRNA